MSSKEQNRRSHLTTFFNTFRKEEECYIQISQPPSKCKQEESENPIIVVNQASTATLVEETILTPPIFGEITKWGWTTGAETKLCKGQKCQV